MRLAASIRDMETVAGAALDRYHAVDRPDMPPPRMAIWVRGDIESEVIAVCECKRVRRRGVRMVNGSMEVDGWRRRREGESQTGKGAGGDSEGREGKGALL